MVMVKNTYFQCFKNPVFLQKLIDRKGRLPETKCTISRSAQAIALSQQSFVGDNIKPLAEVTVDNINTVTLVYQPGQLLHVLQQVGLRTPAIHKTMLGGPNQLVPAKVLHNAVPNDAFHDLAAD